MSQLAINQEIFDVQALLALQDDDEAFARDIITIFLADLPRRTIYLQNALTDGAAAPIAAAAHSLRGGLLGIAAHRAVNASAALEQMALKAAGDSGGEALGNVLIELGAVLRQELELLQRTLSFWLAGSTDR